MTSAVDTIYSISLIHNYYYQYTLWIPKLFIPDSIAPHCLNLLANLHADWTYSIHKYNTAAFGDGIAALSAGIKITGILKRVPRLATNTCIYRLVIEQWVQPLSPIRS